MYGFSEWFAGSEELEVFVTNIRNGVLRSIRPGNGYISVSFPKPGGQVGLAPQLRLAAGVVHTGPLMAEITEKGWKGKTATAALGPALAHWTTGQRGSFEKGMDAGKHSLPSLVGKEMGFLFEIEVFIHLLRSYGLKPLGAKDLAYAMGEKTRLEQEIARKLRNQQLAALACEFIEVHAGSGENGMAGLIYKKSLELIRDCKVDTVEFTGGDVTAYRARLKSDTADLRVGCGTAMAGGRSDVGFSLKAVTETQIEVRSFSIGRALMLLGGSSTAAKKLQSVLQNPLFDEKDKQQEILRVYEKTAARNYQNKPQKLARLLELLVTGGADTLPAYRMLVRNIGEPGWSGAVEKDFVTGEGPGSKLGAKLGSSPAITVKATKTYISLTYMVEGGNHYGTSIKFEPMADGSKVSVYVSNLVSKGGRGY